MPSQENEMVIWEAVEALNRGNLELIDELFAPGYVDHDPSRAGLPPGPEGVKLAWSMFRAAFPDLRVEVEGQISEGDKVAVRGKIQGTHEGELMGIPPTGKRVSITLIDINRIEDGKFVERWGIADMLGMMRQLGVVPAPPEQQRNE